MAIKVDLPDGSGQVVVKHQFNKYAALLVAVCVTMGISLLGIVISIAAHSQAGSAISGNQRAIDQVKTIQAQVAAASLTKHNQNIAHLATLARNIQTAELNSCLEGNLHRGVTNGDARDTADVLSLLITAIAHPSTKQTTQQAALGRSYLLKLRKDVDNLQIAPQLGCITLIKHPVTYVQPRPAYVNPRP